LETGVTAAKQMGVFWFMKRNVKMPSLQNQSNAKHKQCQWAVHGRAATPSVL
jgi:hypothetical protein